MSDEKEVLWGISKINIVSMREAFRHEAQHFTTWLEANIDALSTYQSLHPHVLQHQRLFLLDR